MSPGVLIGNLTNPMQNVTFDNVVVNNPSDSPWGKDYYACWGVDGTAVNTNPVPPCFNGGAQCLRDGECQTAMQKPCCSGKIHETAECGIHGRCGCLDTG